MSYFEEMKAATNDFERLKVVERYTNEFASLMAAAGLKPEVGLVATAKGQVWISYTTIPAASLVEIIASIATIDQKLGDRAAELHGEILNCANYTVALESESGPGEPPTAEEVAKAIEPDPDAETSARLCPDPMTKEDLAEAAALITPLDQLHKGKVDHIVDVNVTDPNGGIRKEQDLVVTLIHRNDEDEIVAISGYVIEHINEFHKRALLMKAAEPDEVAEREYNPKYGYFHFARVKRSRKVYVLTGYRTYGNADYLSGNHPAWGPNAERPSSGEDDVLAGEMEEAEGTATFTSPAPGHRIELDEEPPFKSKEAVESVPLEEQQKTIEEMSAGAHEEQGAPVPEAVEETVEGAVGDYLPPGRNIKLTAPPTRDELENLCRQLFAVKQDKKETDAEFNEQIKSFETDIQAVLHQRSEDRYQRRLSFEDGVPDQEAEAALDAAAEESQETAPCGLQAAPDDDAPGPPDNPEPRLKSAEECAPEASEAEPDDEEEIEIEPDDEEEIEIEHFPHCGELCLICGGAGCKECDGEGVAPAVRESDGDGRLQCAKCGLPRAFWSFLKYGDGRKGHICNVCRKV